MSGTTGAQKQECPFELVEGPPSWKRPKKIRELPQGAINCPDCNLQLRDSYTLVPIENKVNAKIPGRTCDYCRTLYVSDAEKVSKIMKDNPHSEGFTLNGMRLWNFTQEEQKRQKEMKERELREAREKEERELREAKEKEERELREAREKEELELYKGRKKRLAEVDDAIVMVCVEFWNASPQEYIITNRKDSQDGDSVFHYASLEGREIISAAFAEKRYKVGTLNGRRFSVQQIIFKKYGVDKLPEEISPEKILIKTGGGYYSSVMDRQSETIVDLLLYSPFSKRYEIIHATYNRVRRFCYCDIRLYRIFVHKYGNPEISLVFNEKNSSGGTYYNLNEKSVLYGYGYNVSEACGLSKAKRQEILAEIIDLGILKVPRIVDHLKFCISNHSSDKDYYARQKWSEDKEFVENYKVNPERFLIGKAK